MSQQFNWAICVCSGGLDPWVAYDIVNEISATGAMVFLDVAEASLESDPHTALIAALHGANELLLLVGEEASRRRDVALAVENATRLGIPITGLLCSATVSDWEIDRLRRIADVDKIEPKDKYLKNLKRRVRQSASSANSRASEDSIIPPRTLSVHAFVPAPSRHSDVLFCYDPTDHPDVEEVAAWLSERALHPYLYPYRYPYLDPYRDEARDPVTGSRQDMPADFSDKFRAVVGFVGIHARTPWQMPAMRSLVEMCKERRCPLIPVRLKSAPAKVPLFDCLDKSDWVDLRSEHPAALNRLYRIITGFRDYRRVSRPGAGAFGIDSGDTLIDQPQPPLPRAGGETVSVDFVLVTALEEELRPLLALLNGHRRLPPSSEDVRVYFEHDLPVVFADGSRGYYRLAITCLPGMGRVDAATAVSDAVRRFQPGCVLLVGIAGGFASQSVRLGDILVADQVVDYELQKITPEGPEVRYRVHRADPSLLNFAMAYKGEDWRRMVTAKSPSRRAPQRRLGPIATGDKVDAFNEVLRKYGEDWPRLIGVEMEAGGAASACYQAKRPPGFFMVRAVSDLADRNKDSKSVRRWREYACQAAAAYAVDLLQAGPVLPRNPAS